MSGVFMILLAALTLTGQAFANPPYPRDMPILTLYPTGGGEAYTLTLDDLEALPARTVGGFIPDIGDESAEWFGVSLSVLLEALGEPLPQRLTASALDNYHEIIPRHDIEHFDPIIAYRRNGEYLPFSEHGPLVIMYPYAQYPALMKRTYYSRTVWQLSEIRAE
ncbi:molybdopterin-dependent oxidoreductase [Litchfieldella rifensis]|uniref:Molybdopterin-dependent oxidoreductase n=1 Tax=Litchfieldella rifensis TaxID=762643 RepID=A0ABV7LUQ9_9GAMM